MNAAIDILLHELKMKRVQRIEYRHTKCQKRIPVNMQIEHRNHRMYVRSPNCQNDSKFLL